MKWSPCVKTSNAIKPGSSSVSTKSVSLSGKFVMDKMIVEMDQMRTIILSVESIPFLAFLLNSSVTTRSA